MWGRVERADMEPDAMLLVGELPLTGQLPWRSMIPSLADPCWGALQLRGTPAASLGGACSSAFAAAGARNPCTHSHLSSDPALALFRACDVGAVEAFHTTWEVYTIPNGDPLGWSWF